MSEVVLTDYTVISYSRYSCEEALEELSREVREWLALECGWEPQGGVAICHDEKDNLYQVAQAITRRFLNE